ncbi:unnamed protein product, partial [Coregonus sp. 'balchen']
ITYHGHVKGYTFHPSSKVSGLLATETLHPGGPQLSVGCRTVSGGEYRHPGQTQDNTPIWKKFDFQKIVQGMRKHFTLMKNEFLGCWTGPEWKQLVEHILEQTRRAREPSEAGQEQCYISGVWNSALLPPRDGVTRYSGYCTPSCPWLGPFDSKHHDWSSFNTLHICGAGCPWMINVVNTIGIMLSDKADGPFQLEIDFIAT